MYADYFDILMISESLSKKYMWFGYNPLIILSPLFYKLNFVIFQALLLSKLIDSQGTLCA